MSALTAMTAHAARHGRSAATARWSRGRDSGMTGCSSRRAGGVRTDSSRPAQSLFGGGS